MMKKILLIAVLLLAASSYIGCSEGGSESDGGEQTNPNPSPNPNPDPDPNPTPSITYQVADKSAYHYPEGHAYAGQLVRGAAKQNVEKFSFDLIYTGLPKQPVRIHYYIPKTGDVTTMPVLFSMHGAERDATVQTSAWDSYADKYGFVVIAPEFPKSSTVAEWGYSESYNENAYQFGNVMTASGSKTCNPQEQWAYNVIEAAFDHFKEAVGGKQTQYRIFGHSAGAQFVHRMVMAMPNARIERACAASASAWTYPHSEGLKITPTQAIGWPYSPLYTPRANDDDMRTYLQKKMLIMVGDQDTGSDSLDVSDAANYQGSTRYERLLNYDYACRLRAAELGITCAFEKMVVEGKGHGTTGMVDGDSKGHNAYSWLFSDLINK